MATQRLLLAKLIDLFPERGPALLASLLLARATFRFLAAEFKDGPQREIFRRLGAQMADGLLEQFVAMVRRTVEGRLQVYDDWLGRCAGRLGEGFADAGGKTRQGRES